MIRCIASIIMSLAKPSKTTLLAIQCGGYNSPLYISNILPSADLWWTMGRQRSISPHAYIIISRLKSGSSQALPS